MLFAIIWSAVGPSFQIKYREVTRGTESKFFFVAGGNAKLRYQITSGNTGGVFDVEPEVGTIFVAQPLDYEQNKRYRSSYNYYWHP